MQKRIQIAAGTMALALLAASSIAMAAGPQKRPTTGTGTWKTSQAFGKQINGRIAVLNASEATVAVIPVTDSTLIPTQPLALLFLVLAVLGLCGPLIFSWLTRVTVGRR